VGLEAYLESDLIRIEKGVVFIGTGLILLFEHARLRRQSFGGPVIIELLDLTLYGLPRLRLHKASVSLAHTCISLLPSLGLLLLMIHVVGVYHFALQVDLEAPWEVSSPRCRRIVLVAEVVPLLPLVHENAQVRRIAVQLKKQFV